MKYILVLLLIMNIVMSSASAKSSKCSMEKSYRPDCYLKRNDKVLNIALLYYGDYWSMTDLERIEPILIERFFKATNQQLELRVLVKKVFSFKQKMPADFEFNNIKDPARLQRIYYSEKVGGKVIPEVYEEFKRRDSENVLGQLDAILAITGAQFEGLGLADGRVSVTEHPREIAWGLPDGGRVEYITDYRIVDELIHELGHNMFLGHTSTQCQKPELTLEQRKQCCEQSPSKDDVLSYCRNRQNVGENFMHGFESCNQSMIEKLVIPSMLKGGKWKVPGRSRCQ